MSLLVAQPLPSTTREIVNILKYQDTIETIDLANAINSSGIDSLASGIDKIQNKIDDFERDLLARDLNGSLLNYRKTCESFDKLYKNRQIGMTVKSAKDVLDVEGKGIYQHLLYISESLYPQQGIYTELSHYSAELIKAGISVDKYIDSMFFLYQNYVCKAVITIQKILTSINTLEKSEKFILSKSIKDINREYLSLIPRSINLIWQHFFDIVKNPLMIRKKIQLPTVMLKQRTSKNYLTGYKNGCGDSKHPPWIEHRRVKPIFNNFFSCDNHNNNPQIFIAADAKYQKVYLCNGKAAVDRLEIKMQQWKFIPFNKESESVSYLIKNQSSGLLLDGVKRNCIYLKDVKQTLTIHDSVHWIPMLVPTNGLGIEGMSAMKDTIVIKHVLSKKIVHGNEKNIVCPVKSREDDKPTYWVLAT
ncbi:hypothetical protein [Veronia pacifica]|uniref:Uncharacterized protein n=1 Tax=Veronia pacifica TaxID=1080227 RepID=A0A1C3EM76_9GAMM|nr:hypothetical protein [Veronia pacifica]ODA34353.1 hypothetical protein A8L45_06410 [Veronia pacifica]